MVRQPVLAETSIRSGYPAIRLAQLSIRGQVHRARSPGLPADHSDGRPRQRYRYLGAALPAGAAVLLYALATYVATAPGLPERLLPDAVLTLLLYLSPRASTGRGGAPAKPAGSLA